MNPLSNTALPSLKLYTIIIDSDGSGLSSVSFLSTKRFTLDDAVKQMVPDFDRETDRAEMSSIPFYKLEEI